MSENRDYGPDHIANLPQDLLASIGLMAVSSARVEYLVEEAVAGCLGLSVEYGLAVTTHMNMKLRLDVLKSAAEMRIDDLEALDELEELANRIDKGWAKRNDIIHNTVSCDPVTEF